MITTNFEGNYNDFDHIIVAFSGGKDSIAMVLNALEAGADKGKIELWHHNVDGKEELGKDFMDWPSTPAYCKKFAKHFGLTYFESWKVNGFLGEILRNDAPTQATKFETPDGVKQIGGKGPKGTRQMFPQLAASLSTRWCSAYLKVDIMKRAIANQDRFNGKKVLILTGERAKESKARELYAEFEAHFCSNAKRTVFQARPIHKWTEEAVWAILSRWNVNPAPAYRLGWGRLSCMTCIFGGANQWASVKAIAPERVERIANFERQFGKTINRDGRTTVDQLAAKGTPYAGTQDAALVAEAMNPNWDGEIQVSDWALPAGAFKGEGCGAL